jgi:hypothetical protein
LDVLIYGKIDLEVKQQHSRRHRVGICVVNRRLANCRWWSISYCQ